MTKDQTPSVTIFLTLEQDVEAAVAVHRPLVKVRGASNHEHRRTNTRFHPVDRHMGLDKVMLPESDRI